MDLLNLSQPWDCERFPKSKTICYGGGGSSPPPAPKVKVNVSTPKITVPKITTPKITTPKITVPKIKVPSVVDIKDAVNRSDLGSGAVENTIKKSDIGKTTSAGIESIKKEGTKAANQIKSEGNKLLAGDFDLMRAASGTIKGAEETFKRSDIGVKAAQFQDYVMERLGRGKKDKDDDDDTPGASATVGQSATMGQGAMEGMKAGANLSSGRDRVRQNKRKLRATKTA